jgi:ubiquinone biosynthesis protein UbiJ
MWWMFGDLLGEGFVEALRDYKGLTKAHLRALQMECIETLTGPKG